MNWIYSILAGTLLGLGLIEPFLWPFVFAGGALAIAAASAARSLGIAFASGWIMGFVFYSLASYAVWWHTLPLDWLGFDDSWFAYALVTISWTLTAAGLALWTGIFALLFKYLSDDTWHEIVYALILWVVSEWMSAWWFSIQNIGPGSVIGPHFSLLFVGNVLANDTALLQLAWLGGVYMLSAAAIGIGAMLYRIAGAGAGRERVLLVALLVACGAVWLYGTQALQSIPVNEESKTPIRIALVSLQRSPQLAPSRANIEENQDTIMRMLPETVGASIVILPEGANFLRILRSPEASEEASRAFRTTYVGARLPTLIETESVRGARGALMGRMEYYDVASGISQYSQKRFILPMGEYVPYMYKAVIILLGQRDALQEILSYRSFSAAKNVSPVTLNGLTVGGLFCDETMSPDLYRSLASQGAQLFVNSASQSWFHGSRLVAAQMRNIAKIRAAENRRWYVQATDAAPSFVLDPFGRVIVTSAWGSEETVAAEVFARSDITPYMRFGGWIPIFSVMLLLTIIAAHNRRA